MKENTNQKQQLIEDLKKTAKDFPGFIRALFSPIIKLIEKNYDKLSEEQKQHLQKIVQDLKNESNKGIQQIKKYLSQIKDKFTNNNGKSSPDSNNNKESKESNSKNNSKNSKK